MAIPALQAFIGVTGPTAQNDGSTPAVRLGRSAELINQELHGRYYETTYRGNMFTGAKVGVVTSAGLTTTFLGLALYNPNGSGKNLVVNKFGYGFTVAFAAAAAVGLLSGFSTTLFPATNAVVPNTQFWNGTNGAVAGMSSGATLPATPIVNTVFDSGLTGAITTTPYGLGRLVDIEGSIIVPPGGFIGSYTSTASGAVGGNFSFSWEEVLA